MALPPAITTRVAFGRAMAPTGPQAASSARRMGDEVASTMDGRDITRPFVTGLQQPRDPRLRGAVDWGIYDRIFEDDQVFSTLQQRWRAVVSCNWHVLPGDDEDPRSVEAAELMDASLQRIGWDRVTERMLRAIFNGIAVSEVMWAPRRAGGRVLMDFGQIRVRHARRFRFDDQAQLRLLTRSAPEGELLPEHKFWVLTYGGGDDDELYGRGLAEWLYWPTLFKRNGLRFWNVFLDKFGSPTALGRYPRGTADSEKRNLLSALQAIATDSGIAVPEGMVVELLEVAKSGTADFEKLVRYMDEAIAKVVLSQTMTTQDGSSLSQAKVHAGVKQEVVTGDADLASDSFNAGPARWWTDLNFGPDVASPIVTREIEEEEDQQAQAETDKSLKELGWIRTEDSFRDVYGDGYERAETQPLSPMLPAPAEQLDDAAEPTPGDPDPAE